VVEATDRYLKLQIDFVGSNGGSGLSSENDSEKFCDAIFELDEAAQTVTMVCGVTGVF